jgi:uncharacterized protein YndB with AHSA1/START domain
MADTGPLVVEFEVRAPLEHAFAMWTDRVAMWWPSTHTVSGSPEAIVFEPRPGGRIFERAPGGAEHPWGEVLDWEPPTRLRYRWHLFFDPSEATDVEVTFTPLAHSPDGVAVRIAQAGWERLGDAGPPRRSRTYQAWGALIPSYVSATGQGVRDRDGS